MDTNPDIPTVRIGAGAWSGAGVRHGFLGRKGGVSSGRFESLNLSYWVGDDENCVETNWERAERKFPELGQISRVNQVHGNTIHAVTRDSVETRPPADGMVTAETGIMLAIFTADCVPILMIDPKRKIAGALHAGWRGVIGGIAQYGLHAMAALGASQGDIHAAMGPSIGPCCFEVDADLGERFAKEIEGAARYVHAGGAGKAYVDLRGILGMQLERGGVPPGNIASAGPCTRDEAANFFSRRAAGGATTGLQMSYVGFAD